MITLVSKRSKQLILLFIFKQYLHIYLDCTIKASLQFEEIIDRSYEEKGGIFIESRDKMINDQKKIYKARIDLFNVNPEQKCFPE